MSNHKIYLPYVHQQENKTISTKFTPSGPVTTTKQTRNIDKWWALNTIPHFTRNLSKKIVIISRKDKLFAGAPYLEPFYDGIEEANIYVPKIFSTSKTLRDIIKPLDNSCQAIFKPNLLSNKVMSECMKILTANKLNMDFINYEDYSELLTKIRSTLSIPTKTKNEEIAKQALKEFHDFLNHYVPIEIKTIGIKTEALKSDKYIWDLKNIILEDKLYSEACSLTGKLYQGISEAHKLGNKIGKIVMEIVMREGNILKEISTTLMVFPDPKVALAALGTYTYVNFVEFWEKRNRVPVIFKDPHKRVHYGTYLNGNRFASGRCKACGSLNTITKRLRWGKGDEESMGNYFFCNNCSYTNFDAPKDAVIQGY